MGDIRALQSSLGKREPSFMTAKRAPPHVSCMLCRPSNGGYEYRGHDLSPMEEHAIRLHGITRAMLDAQKLAPSNNRDRVYLLPHGVPWLHVVRATN